MLKVAGILLLRLILKCHHLFSNSILSGTSDRSNGLKSFIIFSFTGMGNLLMVTPLIEQLRKCFPEAMITVAVKDGLEEILAHNSSVNRVMTLSEVSKHWRSVRREKIDVSFTTFPSEKIRDAILPYIIACRKRIAHAYEYPFGKNFAFLYTDVVPFEFSTHDSVKNVDLLLALGIAGAKRNNLTYAFEFDSTDNEKAFSFLNEKAAGSGKLWVGLHPGSSSGSLGRAKRWDSAKFALLSDKIVNEVHGVSILFCGPDDEDVVAEIVKLAAPGMIVSRNHSKLQTAAIISKCACFISNDSGLGHLAAAVKVPVISLFGPVNPTKSSPLATRNIIIRKELPCSPCQKLFSEIVCPYDYKCMNQISVDEVFGALTRILASEK